MTRIIFISVVCGLLAGYYILPDAYAQAYIDFSGTALVIGLCVLLFFVGIDLGMDGKVVKNFRDTGWRILIFPIVAIAGTLLSGFLASFFLPLTGREAMSVSAGFGWYTLAPIILSKYSAELSAISFMHNVLRELLGIMLIPYVVKHVGALEACGLPGTASADVSLPILEKEAGPNVVVYGFVMGNAMAASVPFLVPLIIGL